MAGQSVQDAELPRFASRMCGTDKTMSIKGIERTLPVLNW